MNHVSKPAAAPDPVEERYHMGPEVVFDADNGGMTARGACVEWTKLDKYGKPLK